MLFRSTCVPPSGSPEVCDGVDNDCNGLVDDGLGDATCGVGACVRTVRTCVDGVAQDCIAGDPSAEVCNGIDDDCDGTADEDFGTTTCGVGACERTVETCIGGVPQACVPAAPAAFETCANGIDDDCDGTVDEVVQPSGPELRVTNSIGRSQSPSLAWTGSEFGVAWPDDRDGSFRIYFARVSAGGARVGADVRVTDRMRSKSVV